MADLRHRYGLLYGMCGPKNGSLSPWKALHACVLELAMGAAWWDHSKRLPRIVPKRKARHGFVWGLVADPLALIARQRLTADH